MRLCCGLLLWGLSLATVLPSMAAEPIEVRLRQQRETSENSGRFHRIEQAERWDPARTAVIVCDMWDSHHCFRAVQRVNEIAPRMNQFVAAARERGAVVIHAPSDCMDAYQDHPARQRAIGVPAAKAYPEAIDQWCHEIPAEDRERYPIDQSDGGEDDTPREHARWEAELRAMGRNPQQPWLRQVEAIEIDPQLDYVTDRGKEVWNILSDQQIDNVILVGVHTNMCVLGRPFGLRRLAAAGKNVVLCRDLTDTMYNPASWPYVSHFSGTDLIVDYIERYVCPTISSEQLLGGEAFRFRNDGRPHLAMVISESEYETERTLPLFASEQLRADYRLSFVYGSETEPNSLPGIELIEEADVLLLSVRRRTPPPAQLEAVRQFVRTGRPVLGIRTANHAFCLRGERPDGGAADWPELDAEVFGGSYTNHYGNDLTPLVRIAAGAKSHPIMRGLPAIPFAAGGSLYRVAPLNPRCKVLLMGEVPGHPAEPTAWVFERADGGMSFYTSLGAVPDFDHPAFTTLLRNAVDWAGRQTQAGASSR